MAVEIKVAPDEKLELVRAQIIDNSLNSDYFNVTELSDTFSGGKNAFLIAGSELLEPNTEVKVQIRDSAGEVLYLEFSDGYPTEYYEGISKVVAVYVYPTVTAFGPATITLVGQVRDSLDLVKWERQINIDPSLPNTTKVRFYKRPIVSIIEQLAPIYSFDATGSKVASNVTQSFANIKVSQLDTFAGDVKRVKVYRTSKGDISDYDLIQDILVESKELLTTTALSGSVVGEAGLFTTETLKKLWNTGSLSAELTSSRIDNGLSLKGSGYLRYTSSLNLTNGNTYELGIDAFYSASTNSDMGIYVSGSKNGATLIGTLNGTTPTKNLKDQVYSFTLDKAEPTASLYFSQSQSEWHVGNVSLKLSEDSAFSPSEISFVTSMPTVIGNETYNFKFEFYDVNNNYVPVAVTQSALFTGGNNNIGGTLTFISSSTNELSKSVGYDLWFNPTGSVTSSITKVSGSVSSVSASISGTISNVSQSISGTISLVSQSFSSSLSTISASTATTFSDVNSRIFTDATGLVNKAPSTGVAGLYTGNSYMGFHNGNGLVTGWKTYMANNGNFFLTSSVIGGGFLAWDSAGATLQIKGSIDIIGGQAATDISNAAKSGSNAYASASAYSGSLASSIVSVDSKVFTDANGKLSKTPSTTSAGLFLGSSYMGYYDGSNWKTYMANNGNFYLSGAGTDSLSWAGGVLTINGVINVTGGTAATSASVYSVATTSANTTYTNASASAYSMATTSAANAQSAAITAASNYVTQLANGGWTAGNGTFITSTSISSPTIAGNAGYISGLFKVGSGGITLDGSNKKIYIGTGTFGNANTGFYVDSGGNFSLGNQLTFTGGNLSIAGAASIGGSTATTIATGAAAGATAVQNTNSNLTLGLSGGSVGGWTINQTNLTSNNGRTILYNTGFITLKDSQAKDKVTIDSSATLPNPGEGSDSGDIVVPALGAYTAYFDTDHVNMGIGNPGDVWDMGAGGGGYGVSWSRQVLFTPTITGYYEFTSWFPKDSRLGSIGTGGGYQQLRAYIYDLAGNPLINDDGREYLAGPQESALTGTYGDQYPRAGTGVYFSNQFLTAGVTYRFLIQYIVYNIPYGSQLTINGYWPATNVHYIQNVPKVNINQEGFQVIQDTNRYFRVRPSGWYMYNDPAGYGGSPPPYLADQGVATVTGVMGGTMVVLNASDHEWHSEKQKEYIRTAQFSFANRAAGGNFITSFFFGGYGRAFNLVRAYAIFRPDATTGFSDFSSNWYAYAYNIENIVKIATNTFHVTFVEAVMDSAGAYYANGVYTVFIGTRNVDYPGEFSTAAISNQTHLGFDMELTAESGGNISLMVMM